MASVQKKLWFPAKTFGWGWGPPTCWQGWVVTIGYVVLLALDGIFVRPDRNIGWFLAVALLLSAGLTAICWVKGERPQWRWGK